MPNTASPKVNENRSHTECDSANMFQLKLIEPDVSSESSVVELFWPILWQKIKEKSKLLI